MAHYEDIIYVEDKLKCSLCSIFIPNNHHSIEAHINDAGHRDLEDKRILIRNSVAIKGNSFYCYVCDKSMDEYTLKQHLQSLQHITDIAKVKEMVEADGIFLKLHEKTPHCEVSSINCVLCDHSIVFNLNSLSNHIHSDKHRRARAIAVQPLNGILSVEGNDDYLWCKFCKIYFENYIEVIFEHVDKNAKHRQNITKILNLIKDKNITTEKFLMDPKEDKACCHKCNTEIACNVDNLERHIKGKMHNK